MTRAHLLDITHTGQVIEAEAFRLAMAHGDAAWEDEISASLEVLRRAAQRQEPPAAWLDGDEARPPPVPPARPAAGPFAPRRGFCDELYSQKTRYRRFLKSLGNPVDGVIEMHERLADCALARDAERGTTEIQVHIGSTAKSLLQLLDG